MRTDATVAKLSTQVATLGIKIDRLVDGFSAGGNGSAGGRR
jgi:hypothetical protein